MDQSLKTKRGAVPYEQLRVEDYVYCPSEFTENYYDSFLEINHDADKRDGHTAAFVHVEGCGGYTVFNYDQMKELVKTMPSELFKVTAGTIAVNQHAVHSLTQFFIDAQRAWDKHCDRLDALETFERAMPRG